MTGFSSLIVEKHSALLEVTHEEQIAVDADYGTIHKFETNGDDTFKKVYKRSFVAYYERRVSQHFEVSHLLSPSFTGRDEEDLDRLTRSFPAGPSSQRQHERRFVLFGLGGSGKTQICLKYVQAQRERYWGIFWVDARTNESIRQSFIQLARILQVGEDVDSVETDVSQQPQAWLLVFDNPDDPKRSVGRYFPAGNRGDIINTSCNSHCQHYNTVGYQQVGQLSFDDAVSLFGKVIYGTTITWQNDTMGQSKKIVETLGCFALAIVQAGAYIHEASCSLHNYLHIYRRSKRDLLLHLPTHLGTDYHNGMCVSSAFQYRN
ncbi:hypothetical protein LTR41_011231 [Exophiala xenobiotica]|nr:hypothetical protein LTR41_011231 [Exophiala xenobiotica]KAK5550939.1 hypothetical protein LTR46_011048 [Exophiala xenobiotica]